MDCGASCCTPFGDNWSIVTLDPSTDFTVFHKVVDSTLHLQAPSTPARSAASRGVGAPMASKAAAQSTAT